jgi:hypothetical protein
MERNEITRHCASLKGFRAQRRALEGNDDRV